MFSKSLLILGRNYILHSSGKSFWLKFLAVINLMNIVTQRVAGVEVDHEALETFLKF